MTQEKRWKVVEDYWGSGGQLCNPVDCGFFRTERGRMGNGFCRLLDRATDNPADCPGFKEPEEDFPEPTVDNQRL